MNIESRERLAGFVKLARGDRSRRIYARVVEVSATAVQAWEELRSVPDTENLSRIARSGGLTLEQLLEYLDTGKMPHDTNLKSALKLIEILPLSQVAEVAQAAFNRLATECAQV